MKSKPYTYTKKLRAADMQNEKVIARALIKILKDMPAASQQLFLTSLLEVGRAEIVLENRFWRGELENAHITAETEIPEELASLLSAENIEFLISGSKMLDFLATKELDISNHHLNSLTLRVYNAGKEAGLGGSGVVYAEENPPLEAESLTLNEEGVQK